MKAVPRLHAVTDRASLARTDFLDRVESLRPLGSRIAVHVRDREATGRELSDWVHRVGERLEGSGVLLIVNARPDIAAGTQAWGVQLGTGDLTSGDVRRSFPGLFVGRSVHGSEEAEAEQGVDWLFLGPIYETPSHPGRPGAGVALIRMVAAAIATPVIAIGGITAVRAPEVHRAGAWGVAAIRAIWDAADPRAAAVALLAPWEAP